jgi:hypothetical protein
VVAGIALSVAMVVATPFVWRRIGPRRGLRWLAIALVPAGLALSGLASMVGRIAVEIGRFFTSFVFSPFVWAGFALLTGAVGLELASRAMKARGAGAAPATGGKAAGATAGTGRPVGTPEVERSRKAPVDDDMAEIEELLRRRGIT